MSDIAGLLKQRRRRVNDAKEQFFYQFAGSAPVMVAFALTAVSFYAAFATFGVGWARLAGASGWEAAVWPLAVTATTVQALYCRLRLMPGWYPEWARWLFTIVGGAGFVLAGFGIGMYSGGYPKDLPHAAEVFVKGTPGYCLILSVVMTAAFAFALRIPTPEPPTPSDLGRSDLGRS